MSRPLIVLLLSLGLVGCVTQNAPSDNREGISSNRITVNELPVTANNMSAYEIVQRYKPQWLRKRRGNSGITSRSSIKVYLNGGGSPYGGVQSLEEIDGSAVTYIEHYSASEAQRKFGNGNLAGAIYVSTRTASGG